MTTYDERVDGQRILMNDFISLATKISGMMPQVVDPLNEILEFENYQRTLPADDLINVGAAHAHTLMVSEHLKKALNLIMQCENFDPMPPDIDPDYEKARADQAEEWAARAASADPAPPTLILDTFDEKEDV